MRKTQKCAAACAAALFIVQSAIATIDASLQMQLGNPSGATADTNNYNHYLIQRPIEAIDYNATHGEPNWASWDLTTNDANGAVARQDSFSADTNLPSNFYHVGAGEYAGSGYARGHLCPSADRTDSTNDNDMTFLMSNMMPQTTDNNSGVWNNFESYCRSLAQSTNNYELLIICGPSGFTGAKVNTNGYVWIPQYTWKIAVVVPPGPAMATNRITTTNRVIAIKVPNTNGVSSAWTNFITSARQIEVDTGLSFFTALPPDVASVLKDKVDGQTNPPPAIYGFSPAGGSTGTNVVIAGTNFNSASTVTFGGVNASFLINSNTQITAVVPTNANSGFVSVTTPTGTAVSTNSFTVINNGGITVFSGTLAGWDTSILTGGLNNYGPSPMSPTTTAPYLVVTGLTRGSGVGQSGSAATNGWGGTGFTNATASAAIGSNQFATFVITVTNGYKMSFSAVSRFDYRRSSTGPTDGVLQYRIGPGVFNDITNVSYSSTSSSGASIGSIDLSGIAGLQNIGANTNVTFRIVNYGGTSSAGTWYIYDVAGSTAPDLVIQGTITQLPPPAINALAATFSSFNFTNHQFQFMVSGTTGSNYVVQATTNLAAPSWISLVTNAAPFLFIESNADLSGQRFYRCMVAP